VFRHECQTRQPDPEEPNQQTSTHTYRLFDC
jgi:hypothetical protein